MDNRAGHPRMGLIVPKFQSNAVARNRLRRRLTEIWRRELQPTQGGRDLLIKARPPAYEATFAALHADLLTFAGATFGGTTERRERETGSA